MAQLTELLKEWGIRDKDKYREKGKKHKLVIYISNMATNFTKNLYILHLVAAGQDSGRRGTLADLGRSFGGRHKRGMMSSGNFFMKKQQKMSK